MPKRGPDPLKPYRLSMRDRLFLRALAVDATR
jgi:hypothetical protein